MKKSFLIAVMSVMAVVCSAQRYTYESVPGDITQTRIYTLDNGLKVYLSVNKEKPRLQANIAVRTGSRNDPAETTGLAHYLEHLMFKGTNCFGTTDPEAEAPLLDEIERRYEVYRTLTDPAQRKQAYHEIDSVSQLAAQYFIPNEYDKLMSSIGSEGTNAYTSTDVTCYVENIPSNEIEKWAKVQADRFQNMVIRGFHTELEAVYEEKNIGMAQDNRKVFEAIYAKLFPTHPYGTQTTIGTQEHLKNPSITNIKRYFERYYVPNNVAICMAGDFDCDEVMDIITKYFGTWKRSDNLSFPQFPALMPLTHPTDTTVVGKESESLVLGWRFDAAKMAQNDTLDVLQTMLANGKAGLFETELEQTMKARGVGAYNDPMTDYGCFLVFGDPKDNQDLDELKGLILQTIEKFKRGEFSDDLLPAVINNKKLQHYTAMLNNRSRASLMVDAFINGQDWTSVARRLERQSGITKQQMVDFVNRHFKDNYVCVYKRMGTDSTQVKIEKPAITPIPSNRHLQSDFLKEVTSQTVTTIAPRFPDFQKDLVISKANNLPLLYKHNGDDGLFTLQFIYDFGTESNPDISLAADYLEYVGTDKMTVSQIKEEFYKLACSYRINIGQYSSSVTLTGLTENMPQALQLLDRLMNNAKGDQDSYCKYVALVQKSREDEKTSQQANFQRLFSYGMYGEYNPYLNTLSNEQLAQYDPQAMLNQLKKLRDIKHTVLYFGPMSQKELSATLKKYHSVAKRLNDAPAGKRYTEQTTPANEVILAPYEAKNIYMVQYHNENREPDIKQVPVEYMFNSYFGGGMNSIVFQELRESRGLAYSAAARYEIPQRPGDKENYYTYIVSQNDKLMDCIKVFNEIIDTIPQSQEAFEIAKQSLTKSLQTARWTRFNVLSTYYNTKYMNMDKTFSEVVYNALPSITLDDVVKFEKENMVSKTYKYLILGDEKELDMEALEKLGTVKRVSTETIFGY